METPDRMLTIPNVATQLNVKNSWVYTMVESGKLPSYKIGKYRRVRQSELTAWINARREVGQTTEVLR